jgi:diguanylate cyclase (GGDEF)-like protein
VNKLLAQQLEKAKDASGAVDVDRLANLVTEAYEAADRDRQRTDHSIGLMVEERDRMSRELDALVTERTAALKSREEQLEAQNLRFDAAINNMTQALLMFDKDARLVICNNRYLEMYPGAASATLPGATLLECLQARATAGTLGGEPEEIAETVLAGVARGKPFAWLSELPDGRTISIRIHPIADGGWVATNEDVTDRRQAERRIAHMARHDALTDLPNRAYLREFLDDALTRVRPGERLAVLYVDVDEFKGVNDTLGHAIGDELLKAVAERLRGCIREHDAVARVGGDEFAIVQTGIVRGAAEAAALGTRVCEALRAPYRLGAYDIVVEATVGIAIAPDDSDDASDLIKHADLALNRAKGGSHGTFRFFEPEMDARMKARRTLELALRKALTNGEFVLHYQPVVNLADGRVTCCEGLIRWRHPERGEISPAEFIPVAEEMGLIIPIGDWVIHQACADAKAWPEDVRVAINLSPLQLLNPRLVPTIVQELAASGLPASRLEVEITESVLMQNTETTLSALHRLRGLGIRISMDDFGTGYSSLSNLRSFPFDKIKIDRSFINGLPEREDSTAIVRAVASLARSLKMTTTAEGVETSAQMEQVRLLGCTEMQGYYFSRPRPVEHINRLLNRDDVRPAKIA